ncbi:MAG: hypothetical protein AAFY17_01145 [Cyanobacteria bacterium J06642_11]
MSKSCFCTLAVGNRYRAHAKLLAKDIQRYSTSIPLVILTDCPEDFIEFPHVLAYKHHLQSVLGYHDKLWVIEQAISIFDTCIFVDSDVRILGDIPTEMEFPEGLTGRFGCPILKHNKYTKVRPALPLIENSAQTLGLNLDAVVWLHECLFTVRRQNGLEQEFLNQWKVLAYYFQINNIFEGEGNVMGLAAAAAGLNVGFKREDSFPFFKDVIEKERIKKGESSLDLNSPLFKTHKQIEYPHRSFSTKVVQKLTQQWSFYYRWSKMHMAASQNLEFQTLNAAIAPSPMRTALSTR